MKKLLSLLLAAAAMATVSVTAFAQPTATDGKTSEYNIEIQNDGDTAIDGLLTPGNTYQFPLMLSTDGGDAVKLTNEQMKDRKLMVEHVSGRDTMDAFKIEEIDRQYHLIASVKAGWPTKQTNVSYRLKLVDKDSPNKALTTYDVKFKTGYAVLNESAFDGVSNGESVYIPATTPIITQSLFSHANKEANGKPVIFANDDWRFEVKVGGLEDRNMLSNQNDISEIITKYQDQEFKFVSFPGGPSFDFAGKLTIDVSEQADDFDGSYHVYRYLSGKLTKMDAKYIENEEVVEFSTKDLGRFIITNKEIKDSVVEEGGSSSSSSGSSSSNNTGSSGNSGSSNGNNTGNPNTGANDFVAVAAILAMGAGLAVVTASKKSK